MRVEQLWSNAEAGHATRRPARARRDRGRRDRLHAAIASFTPALAPTPPLSTPRTPMICARPLDHARA